MDLERVGIIGLDGMSSPVYGLLEYPSFYKVGVAICYQDSRFDSALVTECYEGYPGKNTGAEYAEDLVNKLEGRLMLIHGLLDMITPQSATLRLLHAFQLANKDVDLVLLPAHGQDIPPYALRRSWDYLVTYLQGIAPPDNYLLGSDC